MLYERLLAEYTIPLPPGHDVNRDDISALLAAGLALRMPDEYARNPEREEPRLVPVLPDEAVVGLLVAEEGRITEEREQLARTRRELDTMRQLYEASRMAPGQQDVDLLFGIDEVNAAYSSVLRAAQREFSILDMAYFDSPPEEIEVAQVSADKVESGELRFRTVYDHSVYTEYPHYMHQMLSESRARGELQRIVPKLPVKMVLADQSLALIALTMSGREAALLVRSDRMLTMLRTYFETVWDEATPLTGEADELAAAHGYGHIPALLGAGLGDDAIARQLDLGLRTVRRRIAEMSEELGAQSRFQAGVLAERAGYVRRDRPAT